MKTKSVLLPEHLRQEAFEQLEAARRLAIPKVEAHLKDLFSEAMKTGKYPAWVSAMADLKDIEPTSPLFWAFLRAHVTGHTLIHLAGHQFAEGITGQSLAAHIGLDLHSFAYEGWESLPRFGLDIASKGAA